ncbi:MFS transporter [Streptomyces silvisoli]|uniref:MFS transporter n=1 Tax=Streptomyces silvisoli TaxID=3034235 RepID=A0ABT5ZP58_9ACTN|nr:MFS transporter [Streptomyces silvisoli]MDF3291592.1 MFS transporter [Streptomyces silvisoli]
MGYLRLLRKRSILVLWSARCLSALGDRLYGVAVMWSVWASTGSVSVTGLVAVVESVPYLVLGAMGRRLVARVSSFRALSYVDAARAAVAGALPFAWKPDHAGMAVLLLAALLLGLLGALFDPNLDALLPGLVEPAQVQQITGLFDLTTRVAHMTGHACAGLLLLFLSKVQLFALDGVAFLVSSAALARLATPSALRTGTAPHAVRAWPLLRSHPLVGLAIGLLGLVPLCTAATTVALPALLAVRHHAGAGAYGMVTAAIGIGALIGNPLASNRRPSRWFLVCCVAWALDGLATACMGFADDLSSLALLSLTTGMAIPVGTVTLRARLGAFLPGERLRLMAVEHTVTRTGYVIALILLPLLADASPRASFVVVGASVTALTATGAALRSRLIRPVGYGTVPAPGGSPEAAVTGKHV